MIMPLAPTAQTRALIVPGESAFWHKAHDVRACAVPPSHYEGTTLHFIVPVGLINCWE
jgi:hypothetical protein